MKYVYFIAYSVKLANGRGEGNTVVTLNEELDSLKDIRHIEDLISKEVGAANIVITNFRLLKQV
jgi:hypothetical protein